MGLGDIKFLNTHIYSMCVCPPICSIVTHPRHLPPVVPPKQVAKSSALESGVLHTDAFLYPEEEDIDGLCESLHIGRWYCAECGSRRTKPLGESISPTWHSLAHHPVSSSRKKWFSQCESPTLVPMLYLVPWQPGHR